MLRLAAALLLSLIAAVVLWLWFPFSRQSDDAPTSVALSEEKLESTPPVTSQPLEARRNETAPERRNEPATSEITIAGHCVDAAGKTVPDVAFVLERYLRPGGFETIERLPAFDERTNAGGSFELRAPAAEHLRLTLKLLDPRFVRREWRWSDLAAGAREDVGEIALVPGATVRGRVLDSAGAPIRVHWRVEMLASGRAEPLGWSPRALAAADGAGSERFEITSLPAGKWKIEARYPTFEIAEERLELAEGEAREIDLRQTSGRDPWREIVVRVETADLMPAPDLKHVKLIAPGGVTKTLEATDPGTGDFRFLDLDPGVYRVQIDDPRYEPWSFDRAEPGPELIEAELKGTCAIEITVVDGSTSVPVERFALELVVHAFQLDGRGHRSQYNSDLHKERKQELHAHGRVSIPDVVAGDFHFVLQAEGWPPRYVIIEKVAPGETRSVTVELHRGVPLAGEVRRAGSSRPAPGATVLLILPARENDGLDSRLLPPNAHTGNEDRWRKEVARTATEDDGSFRFENVQPGKWIVLAVMLGAGEELGFEIGRIPIRAMREDVFVEATHAPAPVVLELPSGGSIYGRASMPEGFRRERIVLQLFRAVESKVPLVLPHNLAESNWDAKLVGTVFLDPSGDYRFDDLAAGAYRIAAAVAVEPDGQVAPEARAELKRTAWNLAELALATGAEVRRDLDLSVVAPAEVRVRLEATGGDIGKTVLHIQRALTSGTSSQGDVFRQSALFDAQNAAIHPGVLPGQKIVFVVGGGGAWFHVFERELEIAAGTTHELVSTVALHAGELEVEGVDGRPLADANVGLAPIWDASIPVYSPDASYTLDGRARARIVLPEGRYRVRPRSGEMRNAAEFSWPAGELVKVQLREGR